MQQRYYDPVAGRFLSVDPVTTDADTGKSFGRYHYANNNPYRYIDPDGRDPNDEVVRRYYDLPPAPTPAPSSNCNCPRLPPVTVTVKKGRYVPPTPHLEAQLFIWAIAEIAGQRVYQSVWGPAGATGVTSEADRKSTRLNSSHGKLSRMPSSA